MITAAEWESFLDDLQQTLDRFAVPRPSRHHTAQHGVAAMNSRHGVVKLSASNLPRFHSAPT